MPRGAARAGGILPGAGALAGNAPAGSRPALLLRRKQGCRLFSRPCPRRGPAPAGPHPQELPAARQRPSPAPAALLHPDQGAAEGPGGRRRPGVGRRRLRPHTGPGPCPRPVLPLPSLSPSHLLSTPLTVPPHCPPPHTVHTPLSSHSPHCPLRTPCEGGRPPRPHTRVSGGPGVTPALGAPCPAVPAPTAGTETLSQSRLGVVQAPLKAEVSAR